MSFEKQTPLSHEAHHVRTPEAVKLMNETAEREAFQARLRTRLGGVSVADTVERPDPETVARYVNRLEG